MKDIFERYIKSIASKFSHEETSEMGYRTDFELLLKGIFESIDVKRIDHDARAKKGNKPDFIVINKDVPILYIEAKNIGTSLDKVEKSEQMARYFGYTNLVLTDYVEFRFYRNGLRYQEPIKIAECDIDRRTTTPLSQNYEHVAKTLLEFTQSQKEPIKSGEHLAKIMGGKGQRIRDNIRHSVETQSEQNAEIIQVYEAIKKMLVHDLTKYAFADMYAQTLVYGLFVARYYDETSETFSRQEARELVPASNPFLQHFFDHIAGPNFDKRLSYIVDELCTVFQHANTKKLIEDYMGDADPVIHFYEDFLKEYDSGLRKKMGAYYTPLPIVRFIVRSVDHILQKEFNLPAGLADTSKLPNNKHRVQILDPAVGTGTFISATIRVIYERLKNQEQEGRWPAYVHNDLLPRLHGFELMMASYTIAHLKLSLAFKQTGFWKFHRRLGIYLTNSLEKSESQQSMISFGFGESIADEAKEAELIKNETPIMVIVGNPPYSGVSSNETPFANSLVKKYKVEPGGNKKLNERKHWLNDDYVKFIALAEDMIEKNKEGVLGFITNHSYLDNPTFRGMRWHLLKTFDSIYIIDLHGNSKKNEISPNGNKDENVFAIQQGVAIILAIKTGNKKSADLAQIYRHDMWGSQKNKLDQLSNSSLEEIKWEKITPRLPNLFFKKVASLEIEKEYQQGFSIADLFVEGVSGIVTMGDGFAIANSKNELNQRLEKAKYEMPTEAELKQRYKLGKNYAKWLLGNLNNLDINKNAFTYIDYRPFDKKWTYFDNKVIWRWRKKIMKHMINKKNISLIASKINRQQSLGYFFVSKHITDFHILDTAGDSTFQFPLYIFNDDGSSIPNLNKEIVERIRKSVDKVTAEDLFDYIYAFLHSPNYREKYKEFLKIDFPRVPYPKGTKIFKELVALGSELRSLHLLESPKVNQFITTYPVAGSDMVEKIAYKDRKVFINKEQYFGNVPESAWSFYIGGYQSAQKWLKDRKGLTLANSDIEHYQKIIVVLTETDRIMNEIEHILK